MNDEYKLLKEMALKNPTGSTIIETFLLYSTMPLSSYFYFFLFKSYKNDKTPLNLFLEIAVWSLPFITISSFFMENVNVTYALIYTFCGIMFYVNYKNGRIKFLSEKRLKELNEKRKYFISMYRGYVMYGVCIVILVVDFPKSYPVRQSKCDYYGISVMDIGSGGFIFSSAMITSATSRSIVSIVKSVSPMMIFGVARIYFLRIFNYHVHIAEYGYHWNFFFTLASVALLVNIFGNSKFDFYLGFISAFAHQYFLSNGLDEYILRDDLRVSIIDQNKEGICTILGYLSIYYFGSAFGRMFQPDKGETFTREDWKRILIKSWSFLFASFCFLALWEQQFLFSRRLANVGYILAVISQSLILVVSSLTLTMFTDPYESLLINIVNSNQFIFFLMGNLSTGLVNVTIDTLTQPQYVCFLVLFAHSFVIVYVRHLWLNYSKVDY